jgi:ferredoxin
MQGSVISIAPNAGMFVLPGQYYRLPRRKKHVTQIGVVKFEKENCVVYTDNTSCGACSEHCPTRACDMVPYIGELTIPEVNESYLHRLRCM